MKQITILIFAVLVLLTFSNCSSTKPLIVSEKSTTQRVSFLPGLSKIEFEDLENPNFLMDGESIPVYMPEGKRIRGMEMMEILMKGDHVPEIYIDDEKEIKAFVMRNATEEEKIEIKSAQEAVFSDSDLIGKTASPFDVTDIHGNVYSLDNYKGKIVVLNFWFIACRPCVLEMPELNELVEKYKNEDITFIGFAPDKKDDIEHFLQKQHFDYNLISDSQATIQEYGVAAFPTHIVINKQSTIDLVLKGFTPTTIEQLDHQIEKLLGEE